MLKESILLVASTGVLIYLIAPSEPAPQPEPAKEEVQKIAASPPPPSKDVWDYDDETDSGNEDFTFGEPMTFVDDGGNEPPPSNGQGNSGATGWYSQSLASNAPPSSGRSPRPGAPGSRENPIALDTDGRTSPTDR